MVVHVYKPSPCREPKAEGSKVPGPSRIGSETLSQKKSKYGDIYRYSYLDLYLYI
jgi:hypothetical protein